MANLSNDETVVILYVFGLVGILQCCLAQLLSFVRATNVKIETKTSQQEPMPTRTFITLDSSDHNSLFCRKLLEVSKDFSNVLFAYITKMFSHHRHKL